MLKLLNFDNALISNIENFNIIKNKLPQVKIKSKEIQSNSVLKESRCSAKNVHYNLDLLYPRRFML